ncbi:inositol monophosphatase family protein [Micromonospora sp. WMMD1155]|uniref:inositol monophosphatase family protein n=1 Tax=Micromonospora sp. WMMD1155 TaxID=3016094 RepID=UPI00249C30EF|nr:inositol monophosphatase family protein [Micromonospora sp. WMMD1155]WFE49385.1 inositol monophosphatase family protein [Micromonospora sp. WMMD1155]
MTTTDHALAIAAAEAGAAVVRARYGSSLTRFRKVGDDFATAADIDAEKAILAVLRDARPQDAVVGEESGRTGMVDVNLDPPFPSRDVFLAARMLADDDFIDRFHPRVVSTSLAVAWVAAGRRAAYLTDRRDLSRSVHFAAGIALCQAAGCVVSGLDGRPLHTGGNGLVVAADEPTHAALLTLVRRQRTATARDS